MEPTQFTGPVRVTLRGGSLTDTKTGRSIVIQDRPVTIGRGESCDLCLDDRRVSILHCELAPTDQGVIVRDHGSKNGTWINDFLLGPEQFGYLRRDMVLRVGDTRLRFAPAEGEQRDLSAKFGQLESRSPAMQRVLDSLQQLARTDIAVHITGESGTGKGYIARAVHAQSARAPKPFVVIDCSAIPPSIAEAELFGYERGAFTGAVKSKASPFVDADGGTVFLDEVGDLPVEVQAKLLRVVDEQEVKSVGQNRYRKVNVRIVSATLHNLSERVNTGRFREDLYSRLCATRIALPPLRDRLEDLGPMSRQILKDLGSGEAFETIPPETLAWMQKRDWNKGNVRQLRQVLKLAVELARGGPLDIEAAYAMASGGEASRSPADETPAEIVYGVLTARGTSYDAVMLEASRVLFERLLSETGDNIVHLCARAGVSRPFLRERLQALGLRRIPLAYGAAAHGKRKRASR